jgi:hypothetical protein
VNFLNIYGKTVRTYPAVFGAAGPLGLILGSIQDARPSSGSMDMICFIIECYSFTPQLYKIVSSPLRYGLC